MMMSRSNDILEELGKDYKFKPDFENGITFEYRQFDKDDYTTRLKVVSDPARPRKATLDIYSFLGSLGANHHYAKIRLGWPRHVHASNGKPWTSMVSGYDLPFGAKPVEFEVMRLVDKKDLKHDKDIAEMRGDSLYGRMRRGDYTHGYWTEDEARAAAIAFFKKHFEPGWILVPDCWDEGPQPTLATS